MTCTLLCTAHYRVKHNNDCSQCNQMLELKVTQIFK